ncbi:MAG: hypothetical protein D6736_02805, partial [Nitrospinota bacterium]
MASGTKYSTRSTVALVIGLTALFLGLVALIISMLTFFQVRGLEERQERYIPSLLPTLPDEPSPEELIGPGPEAGEAAAARRWYGLCPKNSVKSLQDFRKLVLQDKLLRVYYSRFRWQQARLVTLNAPRLAYVSYQKDGQIARTRKKIRLPQGDTIITDGIIQVRTYCCNEVIEEVAAPEPPDPSTGTVTQAPPSP